VKKLLITVVAMAFMFVGCGSKEGVRSEAKKAYIYFTGNTSGVVASIDKSESFSIKSGKNNQYATKPGKRLIEVYRDGVLIIKREVYLGDGVAKEIEVE